MILCIFVNLIRCGLLSYISLYRCIGVIVNMAESNPKFTILNITQNLNLYDTLGINFNATDEEIRKAYRDRARMVHPDKNRHLHAREWMQCVNEAYRILSDKIQRREYNEKLWDEDNAPTSPAIPLPAASRPSSVLEERVKQWLKTNLEIGNQFGVYQTSLAFLQNSKELASFLNKSRPELTKLLKKSAARVQRQQAKQENVQHVKYSTLVPVKNHSKRNEAIQPDDSYNQIQGLLFMARTNAKKRDVADMLPPGTTVPIVDFSCLRSDDLLTLLNIFYNNEFPYRGAKEKKMMNCLIKIIPACNVRALSEGKKADFECVICKQVVTIPAGPKICLPRYGILQPQTVCDVCRDKSYTEDMQCWVDAGLAFLQAEEPNVHAGVGCLYMAHCSRPPGTRSLLQDAQELIRLGSPDMAFPFIATALESTSDARDIVKAHLISSKALKQLADSDDIELFHKWQLLHTSKEAQLCACENNQQESNPAFSSDELFDKVKVITSAIKVVEDQMQQEWNATSKLFCAHLEVAWTNRDYDGIIAILKEERDDDLILMNKNKDYILNALHMFLDAKKAVFSRMLEEDKAHLLFLEGFLDMFEDRFLTGLSHIHTASLLAPISSWLQTAIIDLLLQFLPKFSAAMLDIMDFTLPINTNKNHSMFLFPTSEQLQPPNIRQWPHLVTRSCVNFYKYEAAVFKQIEVGKWNEKAAAMAYIDLVTACEHSSQVAICFINAALWLLKHFTLCLQDPKHSRHDLFATRKAILWCCNGSITIANMSLHPAMQMYIFRLAIGVKLRCDKVCPKLSTNDDAKCLSRWLHKLVYNARLCPFWDYPTVLVSEALILHIVTGRLHSQYILALQDVHPDERPIPNDELQYHLYENDLRKLHPLEDDEGDSRVKAMIAMLEKKGLIMEDVSRLLTSPLSPRSDEGWLIQQTTLGSCEEYSKLYGFIIDTDPDKPSVSILVDPTDEMRGNIGLFSTSDISTVLQLDHENLFPIFFSLDPPNLDQHFHPFQELRFEPKALTGTDLLHTLFETDYLLKSFSVGSEVSSLPPFQQRSVHANLTRSLPLELQEVLKPIHERGSSTSHINRFWIQADELVYSCEQKGSQAIFRVSEPKMSVRTHPILPGPDGKLQDTEHEQDPDSPEAKFAKGFTENYNRIAQYFPMFARLKELVKLQYMAKCVANVLGGLKKRYYDEAVPTDDILLTIHLDNSKNIISGLLETYRHIQSEIEKAMQHNRTSKNVQYKLPTDEEITAEVTNSLLKAGSQRMTYSSLKPYVSSWISSGASQSTTLKLAFFISMSQITVDDIKQMMNRSHRQQFDAFNRLINQLQSAAKQSVSSSAHKSCMWVPAALYEKEIATNAFSLSYGGVLIAPKIREGFVPQSGIASAESVQLNSSKLLSAPFRHVQIHKISAAEGRSGVKKERNSYKCLFSQLRWCSDMDGSSHGSGSGGISSPTGGHRGGSNYQEGAQSYQWCEICSIAMSLCILAIASRQEKGNQNTTPLGAVCKGVLRRTLSLVAQGKFDVLQKKAEERVGRRFLDVTITTTEGVTIVEYKTTGKSSISNGEYSQHIRQLLNYRREYMVEHGVEPKRLILACLMEKGRKSEVLYYSVRLDKIPRTVLDTRDEPTLWGRFKKFKTSLKPKNGEYILYYASKKISYSIRMHCTMFGCFQHSTVLLFIKGTDKIKKLLGITFFWKKYIMIVIITVKCKLIKLKFPVYIMYICIDHMASVLIKIIIYINSIQKA